MSFQSLLQNGAPEVYAPEPQPAYAPAPVTPVAAPAPHAPTFVGYCADVDHPSLIGRVRVQWRDSAGQRQERWLPCLHGLTVRLADRVLVQQVSNWPEPIVVGVVDGFAMRPEAQRLPGPTLELRRDESLRVCGREGQVLLEVHYEDHGPVVRLLDDDVELDLNGRLTVRARSIELEAKLGDVEITASDDVKVQGEMIDLN